MSGYYRKKVPQWPPADNEQNPPNPGFYALAYCLKDCLAADHHFLNERQLDKIRHPNGKKYMMTLNDLPKIPLFGLPGKSSDKIDEICEKSYDDAARDLIPFLEKEIPSAIVDYYQLHQVKLKYTPPNLSATLFVALATYLHIPEDVIASFELEGDNLYYIPKDQSSFLISKMTSDKKTVGLDHKSEKKKSIFHHLAKFFALLTLGLEILIHLTQKSKINPVLVDAKHISGVVGLCAAVKNWFTPSYQTSKNNITGYLSRKKVIPQAKKGKGVDRSNGKSIPADVTPEEQYEKYKEYYKNKASRRNSSSFR